MQNKSDNRKGERKRHINKIKEIYKQNKKDNRKGERKRHIDIKERSEDTGVKGYWFGNGHDKPTSESWRNCLCFTSS